MLQGKKTYLVGIAMVVYAVSALLLGHMGMDEAVKMALEGLGIIFLRTGINKVAA